MYGTNFIFAEATTGIGDLGAALQSVSIFQESDLPITLGEYFLFGFLTKTALLIFGVLLGYNGLRKSYYPTVGEQYYAEIMHTLEGALDGEKERYILSEKSRYETAFARIEAINQMKNSGELDDNTARSMLSAWEAQTALYPYFERVESRYDSIKTCGGEFVYETGYCFLFGTLGGGYLTDMLMQIICAVFAFSSVMSMENRKRSWELLSATAKGKRKIIKNKIVFCG